MLFMGELLFGQKYYFYGLMTKSRLKLLFLQKNKPNEKTSFIRVIDATMGNRFSIAGSSYH